MNIMSNITEDNTSSHKVRDETDVRSPGTDITPCVPSAARPQQHGLIGMNILNDLEDAEDDRMDDDDEELIMNPTVPVSSPRPMNTDNYDDDNDNSHAHDATSGGSNDIPPSPLSAFVAQTDANGVASTPRPSMGTHVLSRTAMSTPVSTSKPSAATPPTPVADTSSIYGTLKSMCCCLLLDDEKMFSEAADHQVLKATDTRETLAQQREDDEYGDMDNDPQAFLLRNGNDQPSKILPPIISADFGKKCLVLDLDETLVHSSFRAVTGADFVIPVQIEDVVHFVYVAKRPGVDKFLVDMAKHYEIVIYTASLNKYADPLLDLLDPKQVIRTRLFRESCVFDEGNYVKDLSLLDRDLSQTIIVDNSPSSYIFHPQNAIDCSSFIDDIMDRELDHIGKFLTGVKDVKDVRDVCYQWRNWPDVKLDQKSLL